MPESMYDKLGDILKDALDSGFFISDEKNKEEIEKAFAVIGISDNFLYDQAKEIYLSRLQELQAKNEINVSPAAKVQNSKKIDSLVAAWQKLEEFYKNS